MKMGIQERCHKDRTITTFEIVFKSRKRDVWSGLK
uniref:Uncharacterized protein n=1 Tax=Rhizophora mucronata TaxID=61149 RepID=A0A2P2IW46_RHIMU